MNFTNSEKTDMMLVYGRCGQNGEEATKAYAEQYPKRTCPSNTFFAKLLKDLLEIGSFEQTVDDGNSKPLEEQVLERIRKEPAISIRRLAFEYGVHISKIRNIQENVN